MVAEEKQFSQRFARGWRSIFLRMKIYESAFPLSLNKINHMAGWQEDGIRGRRASKQEKKIPRTNFWLQIAV